MNKSLQKTKNDFRDVIYKMKDTINVLEKRKKSESYDMDIIERKIREKSLQVEIRDNQLNNLINNYNNLKQEGIVIDKNLQNTMIEAANLEDAFQRFEFIKSTLKNYDNKIIQLLNFIRERDKEIENINIQCNIIFQNIEKKRNEIDKNKNNYIDDKYKITTIPEEINIETLDEDNINFKNDNINENNDKKQNINNINNKDEEILLNDNNNDINKEIKDNDNKENNDNLSYQENEKKGEMKKNYSQTLLDENKKLQEEYKQLIKDNINPIIEGKFSDKNQENSKEIYEENKEDNNEENREENKEETNEETKEENKEESKEEESKNMSNIS
jgi:hypothetical protein